MNRHAEVMRQYRTAYAMAKQTGIPYRTCKNWFRSGRLSDPARWSIVLDGIDQNDDATLRRLAEDWEAALNEARN